MSATLPVLTLGATAQALGSGHTSSFYVNANCFKVGVEPYHCLPRILPPGAWGLDCTLPQQCHPCCVCVCANEGVCVWARGIGEGPTKTFSGQRRLPKVSGGDLVPPVSSLWLKKDRSMTPTKSPCWDQSIEQTDDEVLDLSGSFCTHAPTHLLFSQALKQATLSTND